MEREKASGEHRKSLLLWKVSREYAGIHWCHVVVIVIVSAMHATLPPTTCFALHSSQAKRDFPLEKVISPHENHQHQPGQKCIQTKSVRSQLPLQRSLCANSILDSLQTAAFASTMKCTRKCKKAPSKLSGDCIACSNGAEHQRHKDWKWMKNSEQRINVNEKVLIFCLFVEWRRSHFLSHFFVRSPLMALNAGSLRFGSFSFYSRALSAQTKQTTPSTVEQVSSEWK